MPRWAKLFQRRDPRLAKDKAKEDKDLLEQSLKAVGGKKILQNAKAKGETETFEGGDDVQKKRAKSSKKNVEKTSQKSKNGNDKNLEQVKDEVAKLEDSKLGDSKKLTSSTKTAREDLKPIVGEGAGENLKHQGELLKDSYLDEVIELESVDEPLKSTQKIQRVQTSQEVKGKNPLAQALLSAEIGEEMHKQSKKEKKSQKMDAKKSQTESKTTDGGLRTSQDDAKLQSYNEDSMYLFDEPESFGSEEVSFKTKKKTQKHKGGEESTEAKSASQSKKDANETLSMQGSQRTQILYRSHLARESVRNFAQSLREEVMNYKPPVSKFSMELNPQNLGSLELTISKKGKDLHIQVVSNATAIGLFVQNQADFKANLSQMGFENVDLSFSANDGGGANKREGDSQNSASQDDEQEGNKNGLEDSQMAMQMNIVLPKYA